MVRVPVGSNQRLFHRSVCSFNEDEYLADNPDYVFDCSSMSASRMLFQRANTIKLHYICLHIVQNMPEIRSMLKPGLDLVSDSVFYVQGT